jgi:hypothetical protein
VWLVGVTVSLVLQRLHLPSLAGLGTAFGKLAGMTSLLVGRDGMYLARC